MPEIIVSEENQPAPSSLIVRQVTVEDIQMWNAHTVGEALTLVPGINVQYGASSGDARAWIRGYRDRDTLILFDGIPIASGYQGTIDLNEISIDSVSQIKVMKGAPSVIYGTNGMAGVIDVIPQKGAEDRFVTGTVEFGENNSRSYRGTVGGNQGSNNYFISASFDGADEYGLSGNYLAETNQPEHRRVNSDYSRRSVFGYFNAEESPLGDSSLFYNLVDVDRGFTPQAGVEDPDYERLNLSRRQTIGFSNQFRNLPLSFKLFYNHYESKLTSFDDPDYLQVDEVEKATDYSYGGMLYSTLNLNENNQLVLSLSLKTDVFEGDGELEEGDRAEVTTYNLAAENQFWVSDRLSIAVGGIFTLFDQTQIDETITSFNPQLVLAYTFRPNISLQASVSQRTRFPKLRELYRSRWGNPNLVEQSAETYELGVKYNSESGLVADFTLFQSNLQDLIERPNRRSIYQNLQDSAIKGAEFSAEGWFNDAIYARLSLSYIRAREELADGASRQLRSRPEKTLQTELRYKAPANILLSLNGIYASNLYDVDEDGRYTRLPSYFVANAKASYALNQRISYYLALSNVTDKNYSQKLGYPREGRSLRIGFSFDI